MELLRGAGFQKWQTDILFHGAKSLEDVCTMREVHASGRIPSLLFEASRPLSKYDRRVFSHVTWTELCDRFNAAIAPLAASSPAPFRAQLGDAEKMNEQWFDIIPVSEADVLIERLRAQNRHKARSYTEWLDYLEKIKRNTMGTNEWELEGRKVVQILSAGAEALESQCVMRGVDGSFLLFTKREGTRASWSELCDTFNLAIRPYDLISTSRVQAHLELYEEDGQAWFELREVFVTKLSKQLESIKQHMPDLFNDLTLPTWEARILYAGAIALQKECRMIEVDVTPSRLLFEKWEDCKENWSHRLLFKKWEDCIENWSHLLNTFNVAISEYDPVARKPSRAYLSGVVGKDRQWFEISCLCENWHVLAEPLLETGKMLSVWDCNEGIEWQADNESMRPNRT